MQSDRPQYVKTFDRRMKNHPPKPIAQYDTRTRIDYDRKIAQPDEHIQFQPHCPQPIKSNEFMYANTQGHNKYLDIFMTTNMKDYVPYSEEQQYGIARKDNITVWDWLELTKSHYWGYGLKEFPVKLRGKIEPIYDKMRFAQPTRDRFVRDLKIPASEIQSEMMRKYKKPQQIYQENNNSGVLILPPNIVNTGTSENSMYGSGKMTHSVIDSRGAIVPRRGRFLEK